MKIDRSNLNMNKMAKEDVLETVNEYSGTSH
jgi:hypothetical protein